MIKLKSLLKEYDTKEHRPNPSMDAYILQNKVTTISDWLYHGSPYEGLQNILVDGICGVEHGEVAEYDSFSTSFNNEVLDFFSEMEGTNGLQFKVSNAKVVILDNILTYLVTQLPGSGFDAQIDNEEEFENFCRKFKVPVSNFKQEPYLPYGYLSSLGVDAFMFEYVLKNHQRGYIPFRDESEVCFIGNKGMELLNKSVTGIWVDGEEFDPSIQKHEALHMIRRKI